MTPRPPLLLEVISEGPHCVPCEYAISAVDLVAREFGPLVRVQVLETKRPRDGRRFMELCRRLQGAPPVPSVWIQGRLAFEGIPPLDQLRRRLKKALGWADNHSKESSRCPTRSW